MIHTTASTRRGLRATTALSALLLIEAGLLASPALAQDAPTDVSEPSGPVEGQETPATSAEGEAVDTPADIIVTGSRIPQPNLESAAPVTVVSDQDVKLSGSTRIEDVLNQLPSVGASQSSGVSNDASGAAEVDLRYLGSKRSLALVNGRRMTPGDPADTTQAADLNLIPAALVKRVEVLTGGASSVYGADAVAGVVNFILDTEFEGIRFDGNWSKWQHNQQDPSVGGGLHMSDIMNARGFPIPGDVWDGQQLDGTVTIGAGFDDDRGHAVAYFGYRKVKPVLQGDRDYSACVIQNTGGGVPRCGGSATANPGNLFLFTTFDATTSTVAGLGPGTIEVGLQNIYNFGPLNYYQRPDERYVAGAFANYEITPAIKPYLEFMLMDDRTLAQIAPSGNFFNTTSYNCDNPLMSAEQLAVICAPPNLVVGFIPGGTFPVAAGAPYNDLGPGGTPLLTPFNFIDPFTGGTYQRGYGFMARRNTEGGPRIADLKHTSYRGVLGTRGDLSNAWSYDAYFQYGRVNYSQVYKNEFSQARLIRALNVVDDPRTPGVLDPVCRAVLTGEDPNCVPYDVFGAAPSQAAINYLNVSGLINGQTSEQIANINFTGALGEMGFRTPWAEDGIGVNFGAEYRRESLELNPDALFQAGDLTGQGAPTLPVDGWFRVYELFAETQIPIVRNSFIDELSVGAGYRKSWYTLKGGRKYDTDTYKVSAEFAPIRDVRFRGSYNRAVRAPNIAELFAPQFVGLDGSKDPCAGIGAMTPTDFGCIYSGLPVGQGTPANPAGQYNGLLGGVPTLEPEKATTKTLGVVLQPSFIPRFALTVDYWNIDLKNAIQGYGADAIVTACVNQSTATFESPACALINRSPSGSLWLTPEGFVVDTPNNNGRIRTDGIDINTSYSHDVGFLGRMSANFNGTYIRKYKVDNGLTEEYDCAGLYGPVCSSSIVASSAPIPKWRHKLRVGTQLPFGLGLSAQWRYVGKVKAETLEDNETLGGQFNFDPTLHVKAQSYFDLAATYTLLDRINLRAGVNNIFDNDPPLVTSGNANREGSNLCPTGPCNGNTYPGTWDALGRLFWAGVTINFTPDRSPPPPPPEVAPPPPPPPAPPPATQTCPDGSVILATDVCPAPPPPPPPPAPEPERG